MPVTKKSQHFALTASRRWIFASVFDLEDGRYMLCKQCLCKMPRIPTAHVSHVPVRSLEHSVALLAFCYTVGWGRGSVFYIFIFRTIIYTGSTGNKKVTYIEWVLKRDTSKLRKWGFQKQIIFVYSLSYNFCIPFSSLTRFFFLLLTEKVALWLIFEKVPFRILSGALAVRNGVDHALRES